MNKMLGPTITLEEHYACKELWAGNAGHQHFDGFPQSVIDELNDVGNDRLEIMNRGHVAIQVLSYTPLHLSHSECQYANDRAYEAIKDNPTRFAAFAALSMAEVPDAVTELVRCVKELNFVGAMIQNHLNGTFYDDERFWPIFAKAEELDVPIYLHPAYPSEEMKQAQYVGNYSAGAAKEIGAFGLGWHQQVALHFLRLFASGLFDRHPRLKLIVGHMGEMLPFQLDRILYKLRETVAKRGLREVWDNNLWITTAGMFSLAPMACLLRTTKIERIMYSVDHPFGRHEQGVRFLDELQKSGMVTQEEYADIAYKNAEKLLGIMVRQ